MNKKKKQNTSKVDKHTRSSAKYKSRTSPKKPNIDCASSANYHKVKNITIGNIIYLDNNGTTLLCKDGEKAQREHLRCYNPSSDSSVAQPEKQLLDDARLYLSNLMNADHMTIIFTSGATESNCCILRSVAEAYKRIASQIPHFIVSSIEHASIIECMNSLVKNNNAEVTWLAPTPVGSIQPNDVKNAIKKNTALIVAMYANNELGTITDIKQIADIAHEKDVPLFSDCVQIFGKYKIDTKANGIDALSVSFHKLYGPKRIGLLAIRNDFVEGYQIEGQISGHQQKKLRGGTEDPAGVAGAIAACKWNFTDRDKKNKNLFEMREYIIQQLQNNYPVVWYDEYSKANYPANPANSQNNTIIVIFGPKDQSNAILPNTILLSIVVKNATFCNVAFKKLLDTRGIIISIGSACNTDSDTSSHVIKALNCSHEIQRGVLRISMGDYNKKQEIKKFMNIFLDELRILLLRL